MLFGKGIIHGSLLFNLFSSDLLFMLNSIPFTSYADDNAPEAATGGVP